MIGYRDAVILRGSVYRGLNLALAFLIEIAALAALCWWGFRVSGATWLKVLLGIGAPIVAAIVWGLFAAPRAKFHLSMGPKLVVKAIVFAAATVALIASGQLILGIVFAVIVIANTTMIRAGNLDDGVAE